MTEENPKEEFEVVVKNLFSDKMAKKIWEQYFRRVKWFSKSLSPESQKEIQMEIQDHLYEGFKQEAGKSEAERLLNAIDKIGDPEEFIKPIVAEKLLDDATRTYSPLVIVKGLAFSIGEGVKNFLFSCLFFLGYSIVMIISLLTVLKILYPGYVGIFLHSSGKYSYGYNADVKNATEILGYWFIPIGIVLSVFLYIVLTKLLRVLKKGGRNKKI